MTKIIGILNLNNDSFFDGGKYCSTDKAFERAKEMINEGADIIELGGFSTKPGSIMPPIHEELERIIPSLKKINSLNIPLSIETCRSEVVQEVIKYDNVRYINDTSGLSDKKIIDIIQPLDIQYILLHMPITYEKSNTINPKYNQDIMSELKCFFEEKLSLLKEMKMKKIIIDPGFFYHKGYVENTTIIKRLNELNMFGFPLFIGLSRKSLILPPSYAKTNMVLIESYILTFECLKSDISYIRVHDIPEMKHILKLHKLYNK